MRKILGVLAVAGLAALSAGTASAQEFSVRVGEHGPRHHMMHRGPGFGMVERRIMRPAPRRTVCRTVVREHVRRNGVVVRRPVEECRTVVGRRGFVD